MKYAVITGAAGGMGRAAAGRLIKEGYTVFGLDIRDGQSEPGFHYIKTDLTDIHSVAAAFSTVSSFTDRIHCIINMAGIYDLNSLIEISEEDFLRIFDINLNAVYRTNKTFLPLLADGGRIIITSSELAPLDPLPFTGIYAVTKAAVEKYAYSLRMELQLKGFKVIVIRPGAVNTGMLGDSLKCLDKFCNSTKLYTCNSEKFKKITDSVEAKNISPEKIAGLASRALAEKKPKHVYSINRNPLLLILNALPRRFQCFIIRKILK